MHLCKVTPSFPLSIQQFCSNKAEIRNALSTFMLTLTNLLQDPSFPGYYNSYFVCHEQHMQSTIEALDFMGSCIVLRLLFYVISLPYPTCQLLMVREAYFLELLHFPQHLVQQGLEFDIWICILSPQTNVSMAQL